MTHPLAPSVLEGLSLLLNELSDPIRLIGRDRRVLVINEAARVTAPQGLGHLCGSDGSSRNPSCPECQLSETLERGLFLRWHVVVPREKRASDYFEVTLSPVRGEDGQVIGALEILRDATATLGLEQYLIGRAERQEDEIRKRSDEAETLKAELGALRTTQEEVLYRDRLVAVSQLVAGLAHEIHTPLGAMISSADLVQRMRLRLDQEVRDLDPDVAEGLRSKLELLDTSSSVIVDAARRIQSIVKTLRVFSRLDEAPLKKVDLHEGLDSAIDLLAHKLGGRVAVERDYGDLPQVGCRPDEVNQVFMNLLLNAIQAIPEEGTVRVKTHRDGAAAVIEISDTGAGFSDEQGKRLFELGYTTRRGKGGSGLGLALSRRIVEEHGGTIGATGRPGHGATFSVRLPLDPRVEGKT